MKNARPSRSGHAWCALVLVVAASPSALGGEAKPPAIARLLPDRTLALVVVEDISRTLEGLRRTSPGRLLADPEFQAFAEPMRAHLGKLFEKAATKLRIALADVLPLFDGQMAVALLKQIPKGGPLDIIPELVVMLDVSDPAAASRLLDRVSEGFAAKGRTCRRWEENGVRYMAAPLGGAPLEACVALVDGHLFATVSTGTKLIREIVAASRGERDGRTLARNADFLTAVERAGTRRDVLVFLNVARTAEVFFNFARTRADPAEFAKMRRVFEALGLDGVRSVSLSAAIDPPGFRTGLFIHAPAPRSGVFTLLSEEPMRPSMLRAVPSRARGLLSWSVRPDRLPGIIREVASAAGPDEAERVEGPMAAMEKQLALFGDIARDGVIFIERANVEPVVELANIVLALRTGKRAAVEPFYRLLAGFASVAVAKHGLRMKDETTPEGDMLRSVQLPLGFSPTVALSDDYIVVSPTRQAVRRALTRMSTPGGADGEDAEPLVETSACKEATARVGEPTFLYAYRRAWRAEDYAPILALMPALAGIAYGAVLKEGKAPELLEFLGKINIPAMPSPELLAKYSIPTVLAGRADADGVSVVSWGAGLYPGGLASYESALALTVPAVFTFIGKQADEAAVIELREDEAEVIEEVEW